MNHDDDLIDASEMYLRTMLELEEEGVPALRARIAERLGRSAPSVSQEVARLERAGQLVLTDTHRVRLTPQGRLDAVRVMRKHRLAECLLADIIGLEWQLVHEEACRWEHVLSDAAERRLVKLLGHPTHSPYGNPIPGLAELDGDGSAGLAAEPAAPAALITLAQAPDTAASVMVCRITEQLQSDTAMLTRLDRAGARPNARVAVSHADDYLLISVGDQEAKIDHAAAAHILVTVG